MLDIVDNDFHQAHGIFNLFKGLWTPNMDAKRPALASISLNDFHDPINDQELKAKLVPNGGPIGPQLAN